MRPLRPVATDESGGQIPNCNRSEPQTHQEPDSSWRSELADQRSRPVTRTTRRGKPRVASDEPQRTDSFSIPTEQ